jgi:methylmalonyl-CoA/ethylmalonyl-CoA epimerase
MEFHHIGIATKNINKTMKWLDLNFKIKKISDLVYDKNQDAYLQMIYTKDINIELVSGNIVEKLLEKNISYYHICYLVKDIDQAILEFKGSILISNPKKSILFNDKRVAFLHTPMGLIELLEK